MQKGFKKKAAKIRIINYLLLTPEFRQGIFSASSEQKLEQSSYLRHKLLLSIT